MKKAAAPAKKAGPRNSARVKELELALARAQLAAAKVPRLEEEIAQLQALVAYRDRQLEAAGASLAAHSADRVSGSIAHANVVAARQRNELTTTIRNLERECAEYKAKLMLQEDRTEAAEKKTEEVRTSATQLRELFRSILDD